MVKRTHEKDLNEQGKQYPDNPHNPTTNNDAITAGYEQAAKMRMEERVSGLEHRVRELEMKLEEVENRD